MDLLVGTLLQGLVGGSIIAMLAVGITLVYRSTRVLNFAQGSLATLNTYLYYQLAIVFGWPAPVAFVVVLIAAIPIGMAAELIAVRPLERAEPTARAAGTIGLVLIVQWLVITAWGAEQRFLPVIGSGGITVGTITLGTQHLVIALATIGVGAALAFALSRTRFGLALAATAQDRDAARALGVSPRAVSLATFALASVVGAIAGILDTPLLVLTPSQMTFVFIVALGASAAGGFESLPRTIAAALALGIVQNLVTSYLPYSGLPQAAGFLAVLVTLAVVRRRSNLVDALRGAA